MPNLTYTEEVVTNYSLDEVFYFSTKKQGYTEHKKAHQCMKILSDLIKKYRWDIMNTFDGYKIITNGYGQFKQLETSGQLSEKQTFPAKFVFSKLREFVL